MTLLADLQGDLADAKLEVVNLKTELTELKDENRRLKERLDAKEGSKPEHIDGTYVFEGDDGHYCTACFDTTQRKIRLKSETGHFSVFGKWQCPSCKEFFG